MKYQDFSFYWKIISSSRAVKILFLSFTCEDIGVAMVTKMISQLQESFPILIEFSRAESISYSFASLTRERYFQHSKIKFVSPRGHVISSIEQFGNSNLGTTNLPITCVKNEDQKEDKPRFTSMSY